MITMVQRNLWHELDRLARASLPAISIIMAIVFLGVPGLFPAVAALRDTLTVMSVYFWTLYRPGSLPAPITVVQGLFLGLLTNAPIGVWPVLLLLIQAGVLASRRVLVRQGFILIWGALIVCMLLTSVFEYCAFCILDFTVLPISPIFLQVGLGSLLYPLLVPLLIAAHRGPAAPELA